MNFTIYVAKTKALISFAVTAKLICVFVFAYAKSRFSHDADHFTMSRHGQSLQTLNKVCIYAYDVVLLIHAGFTRVMSTFKAVYT